MSELDPLLAVRGPLLERALGAASATPRERECPRIQHMNGYAESSADAAEQVVCWDLHPLVTQLSLCRATNTELADGADYTKAWHVGANEKRRHAPHSLSATV